MGLEPEFSFFCIIWFRFWDRPKSSKILHARTKDLRFMWRSRQRYSRVTDAHAHVQVSTASGSTKLRGTWDPY